MIAKLLLLKGITGALLGVICIIGAQLRSRFASEAYYLFAFWFNRLLIGIVIGLAWGGLNTLRAIWRGVFLGLLVSLAFYISTVFADIIGFIAGIVYGIIIEYAALRLGEKSR